MNKWWDRRKQRRRKRNREHRNDLKLDAFIDILLWIPELIILPFRIIISMLRSFIKDVF